MERPSIDLGAIGGPTGGESNRMFVIAFIGLVGMLLLGMLGIGGYILFARAGRGPVAVAPTPTVAVTPTHTPTPTLTATPTKTPTPRPTNTPVLLPTPTPTIVQLVPGATPAAAITGVAPTPSPTGVLVQPTPTPPPVGGGAPPQAGFGLGGIVGVGLTLAALAAAARRLRLTD
ncbi:MAG: hypothetical protein ACUVV0_15325 [Anaerolineae bacterium]